jgi:hypothetical protein
VMSLSDLLEGLLNNFLSSHGNEFAYSYTLLNLNTE